MKYSLITKYRGQIMGFAAIIVVLLHFFVELYSDFRFPIVTTILKRGNIGVDIFLFVSGMGLFFSMTKDSNTLSFYQKRIRRVIIPALIISLPYWLLVGILVNKDTVGMFLLNWTGLSLWTHGITTIWYVSLIMLLYLVYPLIFAIQRKHSVIIIIIVTIITFLIFMHVLR